MEDLIWTSPEGIQVKPVYTAKDVENIKPELIPPPGLYPYTRGVRATMYTIKPWTVKLKKKKKKAILTKICR